MKYGTTDGVRQKFTGYLKNEETGLDFAEARMYENRHGRFTAVDPLLASGKSANPQSFNRYVYCLNNPLIFSDPTGLQTGKWYVPITPEGNVDSTRSFKWIENDKPTDTYTEVTQRNARGELIAAAVGLDSNHVVRFNPLGPYGYPSLGEMLLDIAVGPVGGTPYYTMGWDIIRTDEAQRTYMRSGAVEDVSLEVALVVIPLAKGGIGVVSNVGKGLMEAKTTGLTLPENAIVVRNGIPSADRFINGSGVVADEAGNLSGVSVKSAANKTVEELVEGGSPSAVTKNGQIGVTTVKEITEAGGTITPDFPTNPNNPFHCEICGLTGQQLEQIFKQRANPLKKSQ